jgi:hypothetical protein
VSSSDPVYRIGILSALISNYFQIVMTIFQIASLAELNFVLSQVAQNEDGDATAPSLCRILSIYAAAFFCSLASYGLLAYWLKTFDIEQDERSTETVITGSIYSVLTFILITFTIVMLCRLHTIKKKGLEHDSRLLRYFYIVFSVAWCLRVAMTFLFWKLLLEPSP